MTDYLATHDLSYIVSQTCLLDRINSRFSSGQINMLSGNNGAGKTTMLRLLAGFLKPSTGSIWINGDDLSNLNLKEMALRRAVLPQHDALNTIFSVREIIALAELPFSARLTGRTSHACSNAIKEEIIATLEIEHLQERLYHTLSSGEKQRVRLARVIWQTRLSPKKTTWLMLDEPLIALDWGHQRKLLDYLRCMAADGVGIVIVLHDLHWVLQYADTVCLLHNGRVYASGPSSDVLSADNVKNVFRVTLER